MGKGLSPQGFAALCLALQQEGAENINLVTGSHAVPALERGLREARSQGLALPVLWNSSAYELPETLSLLESLVDGYMPDLKTLDSALAARFFHAPDYPEYAQKAILWMLQERPLRFEGTRLRSGVIIRHLVLPGYLESTHRVLAWFAEQAQGRALLSLMTQYTPVRLPGTPSGGAPDRQVQPQEYEQILAWLDRFGITDGFYQELASSPEGAVLPDFSRGEPFPPELARTIWRPPAAH
jgi:putative pyruvate formate lyase activating enzyme